MRFHYGPIPSSPDFVPDADWKALREPSPWVLQLFMLPVGVGMGLWFLYLWLVFTPLGPIALTDSWPRLLLVVAGLVIAHEMIHVSLHPEAGFSRRSIVGFWPSRALFYAHFDGAMSRNRFLCVLLAPFVVLSLAPLAVSATIQVGSGWAAFVSAFNALASCGDLLGVGLLLAQVPSKAIVRNQGWYTYWQPSSAPVV